MVLSFLIVGFVTAGLNIKFDRFFTILMAIFILGKNINSAIEIFLWVILLGSLMIVLENSDKIAQIPKKMKIKFLTIIPLLTLIFSYIGTKLYIQMSETVLIVTLGSLAILYGARLIFIHFSKDEMNYPVNPDSKFMKACGIFGPIISGFAIGFIGTSLKPIKIPIAVKIGKLNLKQTYLGNTITTLWASTFAIIWHITYSNQSSQINFNNFLLGTALWTGIHYVYEFTQMFFPQKFRKTFQIIIGIFLLIVSIKIFKLI